MYDLCPSKLESQKLDSKIIDFTLTLIVANHCNHFQSYAWASRALRVNFGAMNQNLVRDY